MLSTGLSYLALLYNETLIQDASSPSIQASDRSPIAYPRQAIGPPQSAVLPCILVALFSPVADVMPGSLVGPLNLLPWY